MTYFSIYNYYKPEENIPFFTIDSRPSTDKFIVYKEGSHTMDMLSFKYYRSNLYGWLILQANGFIDENDIPDGSVIRIPFPLEEIIFELQNKIQIDQK
jgi:hypothetical protein